MGVSNANSGAKRKPSNVLAMTGGMTAAKARQRAKEPTLPVVKPVCPENMSDKAQQGFARLAPLIEKLGVYTAVDGAAVERLCEIYADVLECQKAIRDDGYTYTTVNEAGQTLIKANPAVAAKRAFEVLFKQYLNEFGMTPASRSRVEAGGTPSGEGDDIFD